MPAPKPHIAPHPSVILATSVRRHTLESGKILRDLIVAYGMTPTVFVSANLAASPSFERLAPALSDAEFGIGLLGEPTRSAPGHRERLRRALDALPAKWREEPVGYWPSDEEVLSPKAARTVNALFHYVVIPEDIPSPYNLPALRTLSLDAHVCALHLAHMCNEADPRATVLDVVYRRFGDLHLSRVRQLAQQTAQSNEERAAYLAALKAGSEPQRFPRPAPAVSEPYLITLDASLALGAAAALADEACKRREPIGRLLGELAAEDIASVAGRTMAPYGGPVFQQLIGLLRGLADLEDRELVAVKAAGDYIARWA